MGDTILVVTPTYHGPMAWVERAIKSLQAQTYENFECWLVKDGCQDSVRWQDFGSHYYACRMCDDCKNRMSYLRDFVKTDSRFKVFDLPINFHGCGWGPRNFALQNTDHEYIAYLDDDNWYEPTHLEVLYKTLTDKNVDYVFTATNLYNIQGVKTGERNAPAPAYCAIDTSEVMHKRYLIEKFGGWHYIPECCDWELIQRWVQNNVPWAHTRQFTLNYMYRGVPGGTARGEEKFS